MTRTAPKKVCVCKVCKRSFSVLVSRLKYGAGKTCSAVCLIESRKNRVSITCAICGVIFERAKSRLTRRPDAGQFCSRKCAGLGAKSVPIAERFWQFVFPNTPDECWEWQSSLSSHGYGQMSAGKGGGSPLSAHRISWELHRGPIPPRMFVLHHCDNRRCVNPAHLFIGTCHDNALDASAKGRLRHGEGHHAAILTEQTVVLCRRLYAAHQASIRALARRYGVQQKAMSDAVHGKTWAHI